MYALKLDLLLPRTCGYLPDDQSAEFVIAPFGDMLFVRMAVLYAAMFVFRVAPIPQLPNNTMHCLMSKLVNREGIIIQSFGRYRGRAPRTTLLILHG